MAECIVNISQNSFQVWIWIKTLWKKLSKHLRLKEKLLARIINNNKKIHWEIKIPILLLETINNNNLKKQNNQRRTTFHKNNNYNVLQTLKSLQEMSKTRNQFNNNKAFIITKNCRKNLYQTRSY